MEKIIEIFKLKVDKNEIYYWRIIHLKIWKCYNITQKISEIKLLLGTTIKCFSSSRALKKPINRNSINKKKITLISKICVTNTKYQWGRKWIFTMPNYKVYWKNSLLENNQVCLEDSFSLFVHSFIDSLEIHIFQTI